RSAEIEPFNDAAGVCAVEHAAEDDTDRGADQVARHLLGSAQFALVLELELARNRGEGGIEIGDPRYGQRLTIDEGASLRIRNHQLERRDGKPLTHSRALVDLSIGSRLEGD